nr:caspase family protein [Deltaproteobacteria bacterium]
MDEVKSKRGEPIAKYLHGLWLHAARYQSYSWKVRVAARAILILFFLLVFPMREAHSLGDGLCHYWGVLVGISDFCNPNIHDLTYAADDVIALHDLLVQDERWSDSRLTVLTNSQASKAAVENALVSMAASSDSDDVCLIFFSGHGGQANTDLPPYDEGDGVDEYIPCWDTNLQDYSADILDDELGNLLGQIKGKKVVLLDTCFSGGHIKSSSKAIGQEKREAAVTTKFLSKPFEYGTGMNEKDDGFVRDLVRYLPEVKDAHDQSDIVVLTACDDDEVSYETPAFGHGEFTYFLLLGLQSYDANGNGQVSVGESFAYLDPALRAYNPTVTPQKYDSIVEEVDIVQQITNNRMTVIGHGDFNWVYPFNTHFKKRRAEYIYSPSQLGPAGDITGLKLFVAQPPCMPLGSCAVRMTCTNISSYSAPPEWTSGEWTTVYSGIMTITESGPVSFPFSAPFHYDGTRNVIIDFSFSNPIWYNCGTFFGSYSEQYTMIYHARDDDTYGEPTTWAGISPPPVRDENPPDAAGSYLDVELEFAAPGTVLSSVPQITAVTSTATTLPVPDIPIQLNLSAVSPDGTPLQYQFYYKAGYGTPEWDTTVWQIVQSWGPVEGATYYLPSGNCYLVGHVVPSGETWETGDPQGGFNVISSGPVRITNVFSDLTGQPAPGQVIRFTVDAVGPQNVALQYRFCYRAGYGTPNWDTSTWQVVQDWSAANSAAYTFGVSGNYFLLGQVIAQGEIWEEGDLQGGFNVVVRRAP